MNLDLTRGQPKRSLVLFEVHCLIFRMHVAPTGYMCFVLADIEECSSSPCENGVCNNQVNSYQCNCNAGWEGTNCDGTNNALKKLLAVKQFLYLLLVETDECASNPCNTNAVCTDGVNSFSCACPEGWADANCQGFKNTEKYFLFFYYMAKFLTTNVSVSI